MNKPPLSDVIQQHIDDLWDAMAMINGAVNDPELPDTCHESFRLVRMAQEKLKRFDDALEKVL